MPWILTLGNFRAAALRSGALLWVAILHCVFCPPVFGTGIHIGARDAGDCIWDGAHDISPCLQLAIEAAGSNGMVHIPAGTWPVAKEIVARSDLTIEGDGQKSVLKAAAGNQSNPVLLRIDVGTHNVIVRKVTFDGGGSDFPNDNPVIAGTTVAHVLFDHVVVRNTRGVGLLLQGGTTESGVQHSRFFNLGNHWRTTLSPQDRIQGLVFCCGAGNKNNFANDNYLLDIGLDALQIGDQDGFIARNNLFQLSNAQFHLVEADDYPAGIFILQSRHVHVDGNTVRNAPGNGIDAPGVQDSQISHNRVTGAGHAGIGIFLGYDHQTESRNISITGNTIADNVHWNHAAFLGGITIAGGTPSDITISKNTVTDRQSSKTQRYGVQVLRGTKICNLTIDPDNRLSGNATSAISIE